MKKFLSILFSLVLGLSLMCGCGNVGGGDNTGGGNNGGDNGDNNTPGSGGEPVTPPVEVVVDNSTYGSFWMRNHDYKTMPVTAFNALPQQTGNYTHNYIGSEQTYKDYAEAGINTMMGLNEGTSNAAVLQALDWCAENGLAYLLPLGGADNITNDSIVKGQLMQVKYHDAFAGVMQCDEPGRVQFEKLHSSRDKLINLMPEDTDGALWHVNLFPTYANQYQLYFRIQTDSSVLPEGGYDYNQYVNDYLEIYKPQVLSYDNYPLRTNFPDLNNSWFNNMQIIRKGAQSKNIPFWVYVQTCKYSGGTRIPSCDADIMWQVNTSLSFGAKGIQYFCGVVPLNNTQEKFSGAIFDRDGNKTDVYNYVKKANAQLAACDEVLMCSISKGVIAIGDMPTGETLTGHELLTKYGKLASAQGEHSIVGCFDYNGKDAYYVTNNSLTQAETLTLTFAQSVSGYTVQATNKASFSGSSATLNLEAGEGVLVVLE